MRYHCASLVIALALAGCAETSVKFSSSETAAASPASSPTSLPAAAEHLHQTSSFALDAESADFSTEVYDRIDEGRFQLVSAAPLSTFSIDVDTASYANVRRFLQQGHWPPPGSVRIEELINYFPYRDAPPAGAGPFAVHAEVAACPWQPRHRLVRFTIKGKELHRHERPVSNLVFLLDVSGSMQDANKLPLVKQALELLVRDLGENDRVAIVVYAGSTGLVLPSTTADRTTEILAALDRLQAGGSTNGGAGIQLAYQVATENFIPKGTNRVILCTDGDFNVGISDRGQLVQLVEQQARSGVFLSVLGFGRGNLKDATMEQLADKGNGNYGYIDSLQEARKLLVEQMSGTLVTIAKDVKLQVEFNPQTVAAYRLIGYENRTLATKDFRDDRQDAGDIGAGHTVTALYEVVTAGTDLPEISGLETAREAASASVVSVTASDELLTLRLRYKEPDGETSQEIVAGLHDVDRQFAAASDDYRFAAAVATFGMLLRQSRFAGDATFADVQEWARNALGEDSNGYRAEFLRLVRQAENLQPAQTAILD